MGWNLPVPVGAAEWNGLSVVGVGGNRRDTVPDLDRVDPDLPLVVAVEGMLSPPSDAVSGLVSVTYRIYQMKR